jgi:peptidoglycan-N-acetylglucosamine deacetylase
MGFPIKRALKRLIPPSVVRYRGSAWGRGVALTFDDGPYPEITGRILETLQDRGHRATFFVLGEQVERAPEMLPRILEAACEIGNHTHTHRRMSRISVGQAAWEIERAELAIRAACGQPSTHFRPPGGELSPQLLWHLRHTRMPAPVLWSWCISHEDRQSADEIVESLARAEVTAGEILLLHDDHLETAQALPALLDLLEERGLHSVTLSELMAGVASGPAPVPRRAAL